MVTRADKNDDEILARMAAQGDVVPMSAHGHIKTTTEPKPTPEIQLDRHPTTRDMKGKPQETVGGVEMPS